MRNSALPKSALYILLAGALAAQAPGPPLLQTAMRGGGFPYVQEHAFVTLADFDGDGDLDAFLACAYTQDLLFFNDGKGGFENVTSGRIPPGKKDAPYQGVAAGDADGDGDLDLVVSHSDWTASDEDVELWLNDGKGAFQAASGRIPAFKAQPVLLFDADGDGDLDLFYGSPGTKPDPKVGLLINNGKGYFTDVSAANLPVIKDFAYTMVAGDVDGDRDLDLVVGTYKSLYPKKGGDPWVDVLLLGDGTGKFVQAPAGNFPSTPTRTRSLNLFDWESDGDLDLILGQGSHYDYEYDILYLNDGKGLFTLDTTGKLPVVKNGPYAYQVADFDQDGRLDLFAPGTGQARLLHNEGGGVFKDITATHLPVDPRNRTRTAASGDLDKDGDVDILASSGNEMRFLCNHQGRFTCPVEHWLPFQPTGAECVLMGDVDGDGDVDAVFGCYPTYKDIPAGNKLYLNDGRGFFVDATTGRLPVDSDATCSGALFDVDHDGDLDLVFGNETGGTKLYLNDGFGVFADVSGTHIPANANDLTYGLKAGDVNGDRHPDLVLANAPAWYGGPSRLLLNDGTGKFTDVTAANLPLVTPNASRGVELGDVDGDGDLDILIGDGFSTAGGAMNFLWLNDGTGRFTDASANLPRVMTETNQLVLGDIDGDGDLDLYEATGIFKATPQADRLYLNDGKGVFTEVTAARLPASAQRPDFSFCTIMLDLDGDGDLDIFSSKAFVMTDLGDQNLLLLNDGTGRFVDGTGRIPACNDHTNWVAAADVDGDGDLDVVSGCYYESQVYLNLTRQVWAPQFARLGTTYVYDTFSNQPDPSLRWVLPIISAGLLHIPQRLPGIEGLFRLDPYLSVFLGQAAVDPAQGKATVKISIPNDPLFLGLKFYMEAVVPDPTGFHFTNTFTDCIIQ